MDLYVLSARLEATIVDLGRFQSVARMQQVRLAHAFLTRPPPTRRALSGGPGLRWSPHNRLFADQPAALS